ncbi:hypothetical protein MY11210_009026 [Beauveria gryllotalpidicola]
MRVHALSALSLVGLATTAASIQLDRRQQATDEDSTACLSSIIALAEASPTLPAALEVATGDCVPTKLTEAAASLTSDVKAWYTKITDAISDCPAWPSASTIPTLPALTIAVCTGEQPSRDATATTTSAFGNAIATSTNPTRPSISSLSTAASGTESATTSARSSAASGSAARSATTSSSQSTNAAARETGVIFAAVAMAAFGAAAL